MNKYWTSWTLQFGQYYVGILIWINENIGQRFLKLSFFGLANEAKLKLLIGFSNQEFSFYTIFMNFVFCKDNEWREFYIPVQGQLRLSSEKLGFYGYFVTWSYSDWKKTLWIQNIHYASWK